MGDILLVPVAVPTHLFCHLHGKLNGVGTGVFTVFLQGPRDVTAAEVIALERKLNMFQINGAFGSCRL